MPRIRITRLLLVPVLGLAVVSHHAHAEGSGWDRLVPLIGLVLLLAAMGGRIWASAYLTGRKDRVLVTEGPYSVVRNPLYLFSLVGFVGAGLALESLTLTGLLLVVFLVGHWPAMVAEERKLEGLFGNDYVQYRNSIPRLLPAIHRLTPGGTMTLDPVRFRAALRDCLVLPLVFVAAELLEWGQLEGILPVIIHIP